jgi:hypothetical protein
MLSLTSIKLGSKNVYRHQGGMYLHHLILPNNLDVSVLGQFDRSASASSGQWALSRVKDEVREQHG